MGAYQSPAKDGGQHSVRTLVPIAGLLTVLVFTIAALALTRPDSSSSPIVRPGSPENYEVGQPTYFQAQDFWLVRRDRWGFGFVALANRDTHASEASGECDIRWVRPKAEGSGGVFRGECSGSEFDTWGSDLGVARRSLDYYPASLEGDTILVDTGMIWCHDPQYRWWASEGDKCITPE